MKYDYGGPLRSAGEVFAGPTRGGQGQGATVVRDIAGRMECDRESTFVVLAEPDS
ncbi:hypothetical protein [Nocardia sp. NPDC049149]|uniref:hypothetical protein n=1 Tax=Nocardia sp. NPDC049149 TaxID=3364315 RepID=UPI0037160B79